jgi:demethylmenaquinone methyltransferase/2-methoxy-6-polyprenyl-1,4-benzoquinol methylase
LERLYDKYSFQVVPRLGHIVAGDEASYRYLAESIRTFPDQETFTAMIADAGLGNISYRNLAGGVVAMHSAWRI